MNCGSFWAFLQKGSNKPLAKGGVPPKGINQRCRKRIDLALRQTILYGEYNCGNGMKSFVEETVRVHRPPSRILPKIKLPVVRVVLAHIVRLTKVGRVVDLYRVPGNGESELVGSARDALRFLRTTRATTSCFHSSSGI